MLTMVCQSTEESGWPPEEWTKTKIRLANTDAPPTRQALNVFMRYLLKVKLSNHTHICSVVGRTCILFSSKAICALY